MASRDPIDLVFGEASFKIRPLTFSQVEQLSDLFDKQTGDAQESGVVGQMRLARSAIGIALQRDHKDVDIDNLECDLQELPGQLLAVMGLGGFKPKGE